MVARRRAQGTAITAVCSLMGVIGRMARNWSLAQKRKRGSGVGAWSWPEAEMRSFVGGTRAHYPRWVEGDAETELSVVASKGEGCPRTEVSP